MTRTVKILVAEDDTGARDLIRTHLASAGYHAYTARDGVDALQRTRELRPEGLVLDINMPRTDGFQVLAAIRADPNLARTRVLVLTARQPWAT
jgi:CheY-like chemotaxis protein